MSAISRMYKTAKWRRLRQQQLHSEPLCRMCEHLGMVTEATVADHVIPHRGNPELFFDAANLQSLCKPHHDSDKQSIERGGDRHLRGAAPDGWPIHRPRETGGESSARQTVEPRTAAGSSLDKRPEKTLPVH